MPPLQSRRSERCEILHILDLFCAAAPKPLCHLEFITVHLKRKMLRCGWLESPLCDNYTCLVFIILSGCVVALTTFIAHSSWYITVRQNILKYRCMQWEIGILLRIFAGFTTTKKHLRNQSSNVVTFPDIICDNQCY